MQIWIHHSERSLGGFFDAMTAAAAPAANAAAAAATAVDEDFPP